MMKEFTESLAKAQVIQVDGAWFTNWKVSKDYLPILELEVSDETWEYRIPVDSEVTYQSDVWRVETLEGDVFHITIYTAQKIVPEGI